MALLRPEWWGQIIAAFSTSKSAEIQPTTTEGKDGCTEDLVADILVKRCFCNRIGCHRHVDGYEKSFGGRELLKKMKWLPTQRLAEMIDAKPLLVGTGAVG